MSAGKGYIVTVTSGGLEIPPAKVPDEQGIHTLLKDYLLSPEPTLELNIKIQRVWTREAVASNRFAPGARVIIQLKLWFYDMRKQDGQPLASREYYGEILRESEKAWLVKAVPSVRESRYCNRCGREITNPASIWCGYGPWCATQVGIERPTSLSQEEKKQILDTIRSLSPGRAENLWFPKKGIEDMVVEGGEHVLGQLEEDRSEGDMEWANRHRFERGERGEGGEGGEGGDWTDDDVPF